MSVSRFRKIVWAHYKRHGRRGLPWRRTRDPYKILVSEVMLQQTQVERVAPFYAKFIKKFPTPERLASASLTSVLQMWQGLGYNRRAKLLREAAQKLVDTPLSGTRLNLVKRLEALPGVGPYTARAIAAFAWNEDVIFIETNIRTAVIHHFFANKKRVSDAEIAKILGRLLPKGKARKWYSALMDYGAHLKHSGISHNSRSKKYVKQSKFSGSLREARGTILRELVKASRTEKCLIGLLGDERVAQVCVALGVLRKENLIAKKNGRYALAD